MKRLPDWRLYLVTDRALARPRPLEEVVLAAVRGGVKTLRQVANPRRFLLGILAVSAD